MQLHDVRVHPSKSDLKREDQLAWKIAAVAADPAPVPADTAEMIVNRVIDNAAVAIANRGSSPDRSSGALAANLADRILDGRFSDFDTLAHAIARASREVQHALDDSVASRDELEAAGWTIDIPASAEQRLRDSGVTPSAQFL